MEETNDNQYQPSENDSVNVTNHSIVNTSVPASPQPTESIDANLMETEAMNAISETIQEEAFVSVLELPTTMVSDVIETPEVIEATDPFQSEANKEPQPDLIQPDPFQPAVNLDPQPDARPADVFTLDYESDTSSEHTEARPEPKTVLHSDLTKWQNKPYLGGFRKRQIEYFHAVAQTTTPQDIQAMNRKERFHRDSQTVYEQNNKTQTVKTLGTQMTRSGCYVTRVTDYIIRPKKYQTADELFQLKTKCAITIQCFVRCFLARKRARDLYKQKQEKIKSFKEKEQRRVQLLEKKRLIENEKRLHPKSTKDFELLYSGLENWRSMETSRINKMKLIEPARLAALADLLDQESALLQKIDKLKIEANVENRERGIVQFLEKISSPKKWMCKNHNVVSVDTPNIIRARELRDLFHALNFPMLTIDERLQILLHVKFTVKEFDCNLTREIVGLIDREGDLISRGRGEQSLEGLRKRISNLFLQFIQTPEFNPEVASYVKFALMSNQPLKENPVYYCRGCTKYKSSTEFYLSTTMKHLGKCKDCTLKENLAIQKTDDASYGNLLKMVKAQEQQKKTTDTQNCISLLQESDMRYLVDVIWNHKSAISGVRNLEELLLTRWNVDEELTPWNCILLTKSEAMTHDLQPNQEIYSIEFRNKIFQKHMVARQHFAMLPKMGHYLNQNYKEKEGKLVPLPKDQPIAC